MNNTIQTIIDSSDKPIIQVASEKFSDSTKGIVVFDRDGTLINDCGQHSDFRKMEFMQGALESIDLLAKNGYRIAIATNQAGLANSKFSLDSMEELHQYLISEVERKVGVTINVIAICPHSKLEKCKCRKPGTDLFESIEQVVQSKISLFIGDAITDQQAANNFGIPFILVRDDDVFPQVRSWCLTQ
jgi:D-glycero-D-manno-heptose 1,7-bisphosphate phosphatase